ncbi:16768_t:CDS:2 [Funneliformis geosporum]|uniref:tRNA-splicing endonuclease subunit Sen34 n=1 Tax=Funneliformis geosporum TaxID=1117311 RepID=A0A9W4WSH0_9GLOM|nr:17524_t:CDS:2 [Funneliformis geosporum]CAI2184302.1 16768_t:CDS:2 [Funneliformis geosporum]
MNLNTPFKVYICCNRKAILWDIEAIRFLRENYRIVGSFIGCLPRYPLQNQLFGLPMTLMPEEVTLLLSKGIIVLVDDAKSHRSPTQAQIEESEQMRSQEEKNQLQEYIKSIEKKRLKIEFLRKNNDSVQPDDPKEKDTSIQQKNQEVQDQQDSLDLENYTSKISGFAPVINIQTTSSFSWYNDNGNCYSSIDLAKQNNLWVWPNVQKEIQKYKVYSDLWDRGYYITSGIKFGGDYLLYPGDPLRYHSHFIATVLDVDRIISPMDIITFGRLGTAVKKSYILCSWDQHQDKAVYHSLEWSGFG